MGEITRENNVPGQAVLPGMAVEMGYEAILLKPSLERFCWEFVLRKDNPASAYQTAINSETTREQARKNAHKLLQKEDVRRRIAQIRQEMKRRYTMTVDDLLQYHGKVMTISRDEFYARTKNGTPIPRSLDDISPEALSILELESEKDSKGNIQVLFKLPTRHQSAVEMARILGLHKDGVNAAKEGVAGLAELLNEISSRHEHRDIVKERGGHCSGGGQ